jgi:hypothetical protein
MRARELAHDAACVLSSKKTDLKKTDLKGSK